MRRRITFAFLTGAAVALLAAAPSMAQTERESSGTAEPQSAQATTANQELKSSVTVGTAGTQVSPLTRAMSARASRTTRKHNSK